MPILTVREQLEFTASLCFASDVGPNVRRNRIQQVHLVSLCAALMNRYIDQFCIYVQALKDVGLERVAGTRIGGHVGEGKRGISGGERKRLSVCHFNNLFACYYCLLTL